MDSAPAPRVDVRWLVPAFGWLLALALVLRFFVAARAILLGLLGAAALASLLGPVARRVPGPRWIGAVLAGLLPWTVFGGLTALFAWAAGRALSADLAGWPQVRQRTDGVLASVAASAGITPAPTVASLASGAKELLAGGGGAEVMAAGATAVTGAVVAVALLFFGSIFLMADDEGKVLRPAVSLLPADRRVQVVDAVHDLVPRLRGWLLGTFTSMTLVGSLTGAGYALVGLDLALPLGLCAGLFQVVPTFGPMMAWVVAALFAAGQGSGMLLAVTAVYAVVQLLETHVITPLVMRRAVHVPPLITLFTIVFWGHVFGLAGVLLAVPLDLTVWTFAERMLKPRQAVAAA